MSEWIETRVPFTFQLSDLRLLTVRKRLAVRRFDLGTDPATLDIDPGGVLARLPRHVDGLLIRSLPIERELPRVGFDGGLIRYVPQQYARYFVDLTIGPDAYLATFSSKSRSTIRRKVRKFSEASGGSIDWREYRTRDQIEEFHRLAREISSRTYQERLLDAGLPESESFRDGMLRAADSDSVRGYLIFLGGSAVAYLYCPIDHGILRYAYLGYLPDPEIAQLSPGTVLLWLVLHKLLEDGGYRMFDFTEGADRRKKGQKGFFATGSQRCAEVYWLRRTPSNLVTVVVHSGMDRGSEWIGDALDRFGLRARVRKAIRSLRGAG